MTRRSRPQSAGAAALAVDRWNENHPVGTSVSYRRIPGEESCPTRTRSPAWLLADTVAVVLVDGVSGCVALSHLDVTP